MASRTLKLRWPRVWCAVLLCRPGRGQVGRHDTDGDVRGLRGVERGAESSSRCRGDAHMRARGTRAGRRRHFSRVSARERNRKSRTQARPYVALRGTPTRVHSIGHVGGRRIPEKHAARGQRSSCTTVGWPAVGATSTTSRLDRRACLSSMQWREKVRIQRPLFGKPKLRVSGRDRTKLIDGLDRQVHAVRGALTASGHPDVWVQGVLCFTTPDLRCSARPRCAGTSSARRTLAKRINKQGPLQPPTIRRDRPAVPPRPSVA